MWYSNTWNLHGILEVCQWLKTEFLDDSYEKKYRDVIWCHTRVITLVNLVSDGIYERGHINLIQVFKKRQHPLLRGKSIIKPYLDIYNVITGSVTGASTGTAETCKNTEPYASLRLHFSAGSAFLLDLGAMLCQCLSGQNLQRMHPVSTTV